MTRFREFLASHALDVALIVTLVSIVAVDEVYQPRLMVSIMYVLPVAIAALRWNVRSVLVVVASFAAITFFDLLQRAAATMQWMGYFWGLTIIAIIALVLANQRDRARREAVRRQKIIHDVERLRQPLTVILGYAQVIVARADAATPTCQRASEAIAREADKMRRMLCDIMVEGAPPDH